MLRCSTDRNPFPTRGPVPNRFRLPLLGLAALVIAGCSGDTGEPPSIVGSWLMTSWRDTSVADKSRSVDNLTGGFLGFTFVATAGGAFTWTLQSVADTQRVQGTYTFHDSTLTFRDPGGNSDNNTVFTARVTATTLVLLLPSTVDYGNGFEPTISTYTFRRE